MIRLCRTLALAAMMVPFLWWSPPLSAQAQWPNRPIRMVVPFPPGGSSDILGRLIAERMARVLNANIVVEDKPGGTTQVGTEFVANAAPDGYTMLLGAASAFTVLPNLRKLPFTLDSFQSIGGVADYIAVMAVKKELPVNTLTEFIAYARRHPDKLTFGSAGEASAGHVYAGTLAQEAGLKLMHVPYRGSALAVNAAVAGDVDFVIDGAAVAMIKAGRLKPLATFYRSRHPELPSVPTLKEVGVEITTASGSGWGILVPKDTPKDITDRLAQALRQVLGEKDIQAVMLKANSVASWQSPEEFRRGLLADQKFYRQLLPAIGIKGE